MKQIKKLLSVLLVLAMVLAHVPSIVVSVDAATKDHTLMFDNKSKRTSYTTSTQVWEDDGVTVTNNKASSTSNVGDYVNPARFYASSELIVNCGGQKITKIIFSASSASYGTALKNSIGSGNFTVTQSSGAVTVTFNTAVTEFKIAKLTGQVRMNGVVVTAEEGSAGSETKYEVSFNLNGVGDTAPATRQVAEGAAYGTLPTPTHEDYNFGGWYKTANCSGEAVTAETIVTAAHTLYAKWTRKPVVTISFDLCYEGATGTPESVNIIEGRTYGTLPEVEREGFLFGGWFVDQECTGTNVQVTDAVDESRTLYAKWIEIVESEVGDTTIDFSSSAHRVSWDESEQVWTNGGVTFTNTKVSGSNAIVSNTNPVRLYKNSLVEIAVAGNYISKIVFATNSTTYAADLNSSLKASDNYTVAVNGKNVTVTFTNAVESFNFDLSGGQVRMDSITVSVWAPAPTYFDVSFDLNGAEGTAPETIQVEEGKAYGELPAPTREDYNFGGWFTDKDCTNAVTEETIVTEAHTLYAKWTLKPMFSVSFDLNYEGAANAPASITVRDGDAYGALPLVTREGYAFAGWFKTADCSGKAVVAADSVSEAHTLYAKWMEGQTVTEVVDFTSTEDFDYYAKEQLIYKNGGLSFINDKADSAKDVCMPGLGYGHVKVFKDATVTIQRDGMIQFIFATEDDAAVQAVLANSLASAGFNYHQKNHVFTVTLSEPTDSVTFTVIGGETQLNYLTAVVLMAEISLDMNCEGATEGPDAVQVVAGNAYGQLPTPVRADYTFAGWFTDADCTTPVDPEAIVMAPHTLYAKWSYTPAVPEGFTYEIDGNNLTIVKYSGSVANLVIESVYYIDGVPYTVTAIGDHAFFNCQNIDSLVIPDTVTSIGEYAFSYTTLRTVTLGNGLVSTGVHAFDTSAVETVILGENIVTIDEGCFTACTSLKSIVLGDKVEVIGDYAFESCLSLESIRMEPSVIEIGNCAFNYCDALTTVYFTGTKLEGNLITIGHTNDTLKNATWKYNYRDPLDYLVFTLNEDGESYTVTGCDESMDSIMEIPATYNGKPVTAIGKSAFYCCINMKGVVIPEGVTSIGDNAFLQCSAMESVILPSTLTHTGEYAFKDCWSLKDVVLPESLTEYGFGLFYNCSAMTSIVIPDGVTALSPSMFNKCFSLETVTIPNSVRSFSLYTFADCNKLETIIYLGLPEEAERMDKGEGNNSLENVEWVYIPTTVPDFFEYKIDGSNMTILSYGGSEKDLAIESIYYIDGVPYTVVEIANYAFSYNKSIESVVIPDTVTTIGKGAFEYTTLKNVTIGNGVASIGMNAFRQCYGLETVTMGKGVTTIGAHAFNSCYNLKTIKIPNGVAYIDTSTFNGCSALETLYLGSGVTKIDLSAFEGCSALTNVYYAGTVEQKGAMSIFSGNDYLKNATWEYVYRNPLDYLVFTLNADGESYSVTDCDRSVDAVLKIPATYNGKPVTIIGVSAFDRCNNLTGVVIPEGVTLIDGGAFSNCGQLKTVVLPSTLTRMEEGVFHSCRSLTDITLPASLISFDRLTFYGCSALKSIVIPEGTTKLTGGMFEGCTSLESITIPVSVTTVNVDAFAECTALTTVYYSGTLAQKNAITFHSGNDCLLNAAWYCNFDSTDEGTSDIVEGWGLTLNDEIVANFQMTFTPEILADEQAYVEVKVGDKVTEVPVSEVNGPLQVAVFATQMNDEITLCVVDGNSGRSEENTFTIRQYCETILASQQYEEYHQLVKEMLNYGGAAQAYFGHNTDNLASEGINGAGQVAVPEITYDTGIHDKIDALKCTGATLVYRDKIALRFYFEGSLEGYTFSATGAAGTPVVNVAGGYVEIADILPQDLDVEVTLEVTDAQGNLLQVAYSPMNYIVRMSKRGSVATQLLVKALYNYHLAAKALAG